MCTHHTRTTHCRALPARTHLHHLWASIFCTARTATRTTSARHPHWWWMVCGGDRSCMYTCTAPPPSHAAAHLLLRASPLRTARTAHSRASNTAAAAASCLLPPAAAPLFHARTHAPACLHTLLLPRRSRSSFSFSHALLLLHSPVFLFACCTLPAPHHRTCTALLHAYIYGMVYHIYLSRWVERYR